MKKIFKYNVAIGPFEVEMPEFSNVMSVQMQSGVPVMWALVDPEQKMIMRKFEVHGTGHDIKAAYADFVGTFQTGPLVWHLFEL